MTREERFWRFVVPEPNTGCFLWSGSRSEFGHGLFWDGDRLVPAHRYLWRITHGELAKDICVCHKCDTPACVNPDHLFLGSQRDNMADMIRKGRKVVVVGAAYRRSRLSDDDIRDIRASSAISSVLENKYGVKQQTISDIRTRRTWKHVE